MATNSVKSFARSRTFWFGILLVINSIAGVFGYLEFTPSVELQDGVSLLTGLLVIIFRFRTSDPIKLR